MVSFLVYYLSFLIIVFPVRLMSPLWSSLNATSLHRLNLMIGLLLYVPIVAITVLTLRRLTEREKGRRIPLGEIWKALGFRFDQVGRDFGRGCLAYLALFPILTIAGALSHWIFNVLLKRYHFFTPINPAEIESMISNTPIDQILILIQTAVAAPIVEELMFRGLLFRGLRIKWGIVMAAVLSSMMFALSHNTLPNGFLTLWSIGMGFSFASIQRDRNSILPNIFMHAIHNGLISFMIALIFSK